jgi:hypothetical protein
MSRDVAFFTFIPSVVHPSTSKSAHRPRRQEDFVLTTSKDRGVDIWRAAVQPLHVWSSSSALVVTAQISGTYRASLLSGDEDETQFNVDPWKLNIEEAPSWTTFSEGIAVREEIASSLGGVSGTVEPPTASDRMQAPPPTIHDHSDAADGSSDPPLENPVSGILNSPSAEISGIPFPSSEPVAASSPAARTSSLSATRVLPSVSSIPVPASDSRAATGSGGEGSTTARRRSSLSRGREAVGSGVGAGRSRSAATVTPYHPDSSLPPYGVPHANHDHRRNHHQSHRVKISGSLHVAAPKTLYDMAKVMKEDVSGVMRTRALGGYGVDSVSACSQSWDAS